MKIFLDKFTCMALLQAILEYRPTSFELRTVSVTYYTLVAWAERVRNKYLGIIPNVFSIKISIAEAHALMIVSVIETTDPWLIASLAELRGSLQQFTLQYEQQTQSNQGLKRLA